MQYDLYEKLKIYKQLYPENAENVTREELEKTIKLISKGGSLWDHYSLLSSSVVS